MKVIAYPVAANVLPMRPATSTRDWMDVNPNKNPYRCLPLSMANSYGWEILSTAEFIAEWNGGMAPNDVRVTLLSGNHPPSAHFGEGTITWHTGYLFKTEYPYGMYVTGAPNYPKPNMIPLSGIVETYWLPFTFTMNWRFTQPGSAKFNVGDVIAHIYPINVHLFDDVEAEIRSISDDPEFEEAYWHWNLSRGKFLKQKSRPGHVWQRNYFRGKHPHTGEKEPTHRTKPNTPEFINKVTKPYAVPEKFRGDLNSSFITKKVEVI